MCRVGRMREVAVEIVVNGQLKFSKKATGRFPTEAEIDAAVKI